MLQDYDKLKVKVNSLEMMIININAEHEKKMQNEQRKQKELNKKI